MGTTATFSGQSSVNVMVSPFSTVRGMPYDEGSTFALVSGSVISEAPLLTFTRTVTLPDIEKIAHEQATIPRPSKVLVSAGSMFHLYLVYRLSPRLWWTKALRVTPFDSTVTS
ncbi:MAG: hypothetical protein ACYTFI_05630 [Planctomycetota bacterium]